MKASVVSFLLLMFMSWPIHAQSQEEQARIPYSTIYKLVALDFKDIQDMTKQEAHFLIKSSLPDVKPQDIQLYIDSKTSKIPLTLNPDGTFSIPIQDNLLKENPFVIANQPKGTMELVGKFSIDGEGQLPVNGGVVRYAVLFLDQAITQAANILDGSLGVEEKDLGGTFLFVPKDASNGDIIFQSKRGDIKIPPDSDGIVRIKYDPEIAKENPWVRFPPASERWRANVQLNVKGKAEQSGAREQKAAP